MLALPPYVLYLSQSNNTNTKHKFNYSSPLNNNNNKYEAEIYLGFLNISLPCMLPLRAGQHISWPFWPYPLASFQEEMSRGPFPRFLCISFTLLYARLTHPPSTARLDLPTFIISLLPTVTTHRSILAPPLPPSATQSRRRHWSYQLGPQGLAPLKTLRSFLYFFHLKAYSCSFMMHSNILVVGILCDQLFLGNWN